MMVVCVVSAVLVLLAAVPAQAVQAAQADSALLRTIQQVDFTKLLNASRAALSGQCNDDLKLYFANILHQQWALQMLDSSAKIPEAVLWGNMYFMGMFDECVAVAAGPDHDFTGKHCLLFINTTLPAASASPVPLEYRYGLCVPSSCSGPEIAAALSDAVSDAGLADLHIYLTEDMCSSGETSELRPGDWVVVAFLISMAVVALCSTCYDLNERKRRGNSRPHPVLSSFSLYSNLKSLMAVSKGPMDSLHGLRTLSMAWVVLGHNYESGLVFMPSSNKLDAIAGMYKDITKLTVLNEYVSVDTFFFLSGLLVCFVFFRDIGRKGTFDTPLAYIHRYIRLTPPLAAMVLLQVTLLMYIGDGPLWPQTSHEAARVCLTDWWTVMVYVQNYVDPIASCLGQSWYLASDMQMFWFSPLLLYPLYLWPVAGAVWLGVVTLGAVGLNFGLAYGNNLGPSIILTPSSYDQLTIDYMPMHTRITPWLVGVAMGYVICGLKARKVQVRLPKAVVALGWLLTTAVCLSVIYTGKVFVDRGYTYLEAAFYLSLHRLGWGLGLSWIVFACVHGYGGPVNTFLSWSAFQPLAKLSYCTYLIHPSVQFYRIGIMRVNNFIGNVDMTYRFLGDWLLANLLALPLSLLFEIPFGNLDRHFFRNVKIFPYPRIQRKEEAKREELEAGKPSGVENAAFEGPATQSSAVPLPAS